MRKFSVCFLITLLSIAVFGNVALAMGGKPPAPPQEKPKFKLKILKMELIPASSLTLPAESKTQVLSGKKILMVIAPKNFRDEELSIPKEMFEAQGIKVTVASSSTNIATGMLGAKVKTDISLMDVDVNNYDAIVFVGGSGSTVYKNDPTALYIAKKAVKEGKVFGAICLAPVIPAKAGILEGKKATVSPTGVHILKKEGAIYTGKSVEIHGKIITGNGPAASKEFGQAILNSL
jgi:protease I